MKNRVVFAVVLLLAASIGQAGLFDPPLQNESFEEEGAWWAATPGWFDYDAGTGNQYQAFQEGEGDLTNFPDADGSVWGALRPPGIHWQQIGTWDPDATYQIDVLVGNRKTWTNGGIIITLWAGGTPPVDQATGDLTTPADIGATQVAASDILITDNVGTWPGTHEDEKKQYSINLNTGTTGTVGDPLFIQVVNANGTGISYFDNVQVIWPVVAVLVHPAMDGVANVNTPTSVDLEWSAPPSYTPTDYKLYVRADDPNFSDTGSNLVDGVSVTPATPTTTYNVSLTHDTTYYWRVDSFDGVDWYTGAAWIFTTAPPTPVVTLDPVDQTVAAGDTAVLTADGLNNPTYTWYKVGSGGDTQVGTGSTLNLNAVTQTDEGEYYCTLSNGAGSVNTTIASLWTERLVAHWTFDDTVADALGVWNGVYTDPNAFNPPPTAVYDANSVSGKSIAIPGGGFTVQVPGSEDFFNFYPLGFSASAWVNTNTDGWAGIVAKQERGQTSDPWAGWGLARSPGNSATVLRGVSGDVQGGGSLADSQWHLVTTTYDGTYLTLYVDGVQAGQSGVLTAVAAKNIHPVVIGAEREDGFTPFDGLLDEVKIWSYSLDPFAVGQLYVDVMDTEVVCVHQDGLQYDFNGDCIVDLADLMNIAEVWLECNIVPDCLYQHPF